MKIIVTALALAFAFPPPRRTRRRRNPRKTMRGTSSMGSITRAGTRGGIAAVATTMPLRGPPIAATIMAFVRLKID